MKAYLALASLLIMLGVGSWGWWQKSRADEAEARADRAEAMVAAHERAAASLNDHLTKVEQDRQKWQQIAESLENEEGIDDDASPYLRGVLERVR